MDKPLFDGISRHLQREDRVNFHYAFKREYKLDFMKLDEYHVEYSLLPKNFISRFKNKLNWDILSVFYPFTAEEIRKYRKFINFCLYVRFQTLKTREVQRNMCKWYGYQFESKISLDKKMYNIIFSHLKPGEDLDENLKSFAKDQMYAYAKPEDGRCVCGQGRDYPSYLIKRRVLDDLLMVHGKDTWPRSTRWLLNIHTEDGT